MCFGRSFRPSSEYMTVHTGEGICQTDTAVCLLASRQQYLLLYVQSASKQRAVFVCQMFVAVCTVLNS